MARLLFRDSQGREGTVELSPTETVYVGRGLECAIRTDDGMVSRRHSQIRMEGGRYVVEDLGSSNGTHLNNVRVQKQAIGHADVIQCGSLTIRFIDEGGAPGVVPQQQQLGGAVPAKKGGTMVLERNDVPPLQGGGCGSGPPPSNPGFGPGGGVPASNPGFGSVPNSGPPSYGGVPSNPGFGGVPSNPGFGGVPNSSPPGYGG